MASNPDRDQPLWLWTGAALVSIAVVSVGVVGGLAAADKSSLSWSNPGFVIAYALMALAVGCLIAAARGWRFPLTRHQYAEERSSVPEAATKLPAQDQSWRPSQHGLLGNAMHYMDQAADEQMRRAAQPDPSPAQDDDRLAVATYGEEQKELQRRAQERAKENLDGLDGGVR